MTDRYFPNEMPDFVAEESHMLEQGENERIEIHQQGSRDSLLRMLSLPFSTLAPRLQRSAIDLKETIVVETWGLTHQHVEDFTLYTGTLGTAFLLLKAFLVTHNKNDLSLCLEIIKKCDSSSSKSSEFYVWESWGMCSGTAKHMGDNQLLRYYLDQFKEMRLPNDPSDELFHGRAGYLWTCLFLNKHLGKDTIPLSTMGPVVKDIIKNGRKLGKSVHWCHGAPGIALTLVKAAEVYGDSEFLKAAMDAAEVVWNRGILKKVGLCHGISGNAYVFLSLYRLTGIVEYLYKAKAFTCFLLDRGHMLMSRGDIHGGDNPFSLYEGLAGMSYLFFDMVQPRTTRFPGYEI